MLLEDGFHTFWVLKVSIHFISFINLITISNTYDVLWNLNIREESFHFFLGGGGGGNFRSSKKLIIFFFSVLVFNPNFLSFGFKIDLCFVYSFIWLLFSMFFYYVPSLKFSRSYFIFVFKLLCFLCFLFSYLPFL